jgi:diguanylate cyclase (GGDEF)-like protein
MARFRAVDTAAGQAALLFVAAGSLGLLAQVVPSTSYPAAVSMVNATAVAFGVAVALAPWERWSDRATLLLVPPAWALIVIGRWFDPPGVGSLYALWFAVVFGWVGTWHPSRTCLKLAPGAALAYAIPFLPGSPAASPESLATVVIGIPIAVLLGEILAAHGAALHRAHRSLESAAALLERANLTDDLTGVGNRRRANSMLDVMRPGDGLALLDLDHFKAVNDTRGHAAGDQVLMDLGAYLLRSVRDADCVARWGGEEFLVLLRGAGDDVGPIVERLLAGWRAEGTGVTVSAGVAVHHDGRGPATTLEAADGLLYRAKSAGRDQVAAEVGPEPALRR